MDTLFNITDIENPNIVVTSDEVYKNLLKGCYVYANK